MTYDKEIKILRKKIAYLETKASKAAAQKAKSDRKKVIGLARKLGYKTAHVLYSELFKAGGKLDELLGTTGALPKKRKRAKITDSLRKSIIAALKTGKTVAEVAKMHKVSVPSVNNIKKAAGLTKSRNSAKMVTKEKTVRKKIKTKRVGLHKVIVAKVPEPAITPGAALE